MTKVFLYLANRSIRVGFLILAVVFFSESCQKGLNCCSGRWLPCGLRFPSLRKVHGACFQALNRFRLRPQ